MSALHPAIRACFAGLYDADVVGSQEPAHLVSLAPFVAECLCKCGSDLVVIRADIERIRSRDQPALRELCRACGWDWDDSPDTLQALDAVCAEIHKALDFRIRHDDLARNASDA